jgi:hypothetical protein
MDANVLSCLSRTRHNTRIFNEPIEEAGGNLRVSQLRGRQQLGVEQKDALAHDLFFLAGGVTEPDVELQAHDVNVGG